MRESHAQRMLLVGAFERDNFGDMLFLLQTERLLTGVETTAAAPFACPVESILGRDVPSYGPLLRNGDFDHIWTVGGEVGATTLEDAFRMASTPAEYFEYSATRSAGARLEILRRLTGLDDMATPYIPRPTAFHRNAGASLVLNSVGFINLTTAPRVRQDAVLEVLREADFISVRDRVSAAFLRDHHIDCTLAPDLIQSISVTRPRPPIPRERTALIQVSDDYLGKYGHEVFAETLAKSQNLRDFELTLFVAGTAPGHDSIASYERVARHFQAVTPSRMIQLSDSRRPWERVDEVASAGLWIGSSLHGRIVAMAYDVPRVSLAKRKLTAYATTWDPAMPHGVTPASLNAAVEVALSSKAASDSPSGLEVGKMALSDFNALLASLMGSDAKERITRRFSTLEERRSREARTRDQRICELERRLRLQEQLMRGPREAGTLCRRVLGRLKYR